MMYYYLQQLKPFIWSQDLWKLNLNHTSIKQQIIFKTNKPKGLKVVKEELRSIGLMVDRLDGR